MSIVVTCRGASSCLRMTRKRVVTTLVKAAHYKHPEIVACIVDVAYLPTVYCRCSTMAYGMWYVYTVLRFGYTVCVCYALYVRNTPYVV